MRWTALVAAALLCAACGGDDDATTNSQTTTPTPDQGNSPPADQGRDMPSTTPGDMSPDQAPAPDQGPGDDMAADLDAGGDDQGADMPPGGMGCAETVLSGALPLTYTTTTKGKPNLFESNRLEWGDDGDVAVLFRAPETAEYTFRIGDNLTDNQGCGVSTTNGAGQFVFHDLNTCPAAGQVRQLPDAFYVAGEASSQEVEIQQDVEVLVLISCAFWAMPVREVDFTLTIDKI